MGETGIFGADDRVELIDGEIFDVSPVGFLHAALVDLLTRHFGRHAADAAIVRCQNPLRLDDTNEPEPDIAVLRPRADRYTTSHPGAADVLLVIEVADTSLGYDLGTKVPLYARHSIPEVWVIDTATRRTYVFRRPQVLRLDGATAASPTSAEYSEQSIIEPGGTLACEGVIMDSGRPVEVCLATLLPVP